MSCLLWILFLPLFLFGAQSLLRPVLGFLQNTWLLAIFHIQEWAGPNPWSHGRMSSGAFVLGKCGNESDLFVGIWPLHLGISRPFLLGYTNASRETVYSLTCQWAKWEIWTGNFFTQRVVLTHVHHGPSRDFLLPSGTSYPRSHAASLFCNPFAVADKKMLTVGIQARQIWSQLKIFVCNTEAKIARVKMDRLKICNFQDWESIY